MVVAWDRQASAPWHVLWLTGTSVAQAGTKKLQQGGCLETQNLYQVFPDLDRGLKWCENQILETSKLSSHHFIPLVEQLKSLLPNSQQIVKLMKYVEPLQLREGDFLFKQGELSESLYFLESGQVSVILELSSGQTKRLRTYNSGIILGEISLYGNVPRSASVVADEPSCLYHLSTKAFAKIETEEPQLATIFHKKNR